MQAPLHPNLQQVLCYKVYLLLLMHTPKGWIKINMITNPKSYLLWPLHSKLCTSGHESNETNGLTQETSTQTTSS